MKYLLYLIAIAIVAYQLFRIYMVSKKIEEIKMALVGKYLFDNIDSMKQREEILELAGQRMLEYNAISSSDPNLKNLDDIDNRVRHVFIAHAMAELGIDHGLRNFMWTYVRNPMIIKNYDETMWETAKEVLKDKCGITVTL